MIVNGNTLLGLRPIKDMETTKKKAFGLSYGLSEVGYDIRLKQRVEFRPPNWDSFSDSVAYLQEVRCPSAFKHHEKDVSLSFNGWTKVGDEEQTVGRTALASAIETFQVPCNLWGELRNKSTIARQFIDATIGTDVEPGWNGNLTLELIFHGQEPVVLEPGTPIAKVVFHQISDPAHYDGKYQDQEDMPVPPRFSSES